MVTFMMLVGVAASGKSTFAKEHDKKEWVIVSSDEIRKDIYGKEEIQGDPALVFKIAHEEILFSLVCGHSVIFDATNLTYKNRKAILDKIPSGVRKNCVVFATPIEDLKKNNAARDRQVPEEVIDRQLRTFEVPVKTEGFDTIEIIRRFKPVDLHEIYFQTNFFNQENSHHSLTLGEHLIAAARYLAGKCDYRIVRAAALHDIGKLYTKTFYTMKGEKTEDAHYYGHPNIGAYVFLCSQNSDIDTAALICYHMQPFFSASEKSQVKWKKRLGSELWNDILLLHEADLAAH